MVEMTVRWGACAGLRVLRAERMELSAVAQMVVSGCRPTIMPMPETMWVICRPGGLRTVNTGAVSLTSPWVIWRCESRID